MTRPPKAGQEECQKLGQKAGTDHKRKHTREQGITNLKQAEVAMAEGSIVAEGHLEDRRAEQTFPSLPDMTCRDPA